VWVHHTDGRPAIKLTFDGRASVIIWSPDGRQLLYKDETARELRVVPADRIAPPQTASPPGNFLPQVWTADGSVIAAMALGTGTPATAITDVDIVRFTPARTAAIQPVVHTPAREGERGLAVSPDGRWLAYTSSATGRDEIWVQPFAGSGAPVRVSVNGGAAPAWAPGGRSLYYIESSRLISVPVKSGGVFEVGASTVVFDNRSGPLSFDVGSDGRILLIPWGPFSGRSPIQIVLNWTALLPAAAPR
jgi:Tol biopolymer transport system component